MVLGELRGSCEVPRAGPRGSGGVLGAGSGGVLGGLGRLLGRLGAVLVPSLAVLVPLRALVRPAWDRSGVRMGSCYTPSDKKDESGAIPIRQFS